MKVSRREMLSLFAAAVPAVAAQGLCRAEERPRLGIADNSFNYRMAADRAAGGGLTDPLTFVDYCHELGAGGVQVTLGLRDNDYLHRLRTKVEAHGMYLEGSIRMVRDKADLDRFSREVAGAKQAGASVLRTVLTSGRRYEAYPTADAFKQATERAYQNVTLAEPTVARNDLRLAVENHKDWRIAEFTNLLKRIDSRHVGVCVDTGNSIALLEDPVEVVEAYAPWAYSVHFKDMAVAEYEEGFLLAEVSLGEGFLDLPKLAGILRRAQPATHFSLEMITRDPLKVPSLTPRYWATADSVPGRDLARMLTVVRKHKQSPPVVSKLPKEQQIAIEEKNVRRCLEYARKNLEL